MPDLIECLELAAKSGRIDQDTVDSILLSDDPHKALDLHIDSLNRVRKQAVIQSIRNHEVDLKQKEYQERVNKLVDEGKLEHRIVDPRKSALANGLASMMVRDIWGVAQHENADMLANRYKTRYHAKMAGIIHKYRSKLKLTGFTQDTEGLKNLIRKIGGEDVGDSELAGMADEIKELMELIRVERNEVGGHIPKLEDYLPQPMHNEKAITSIDSDEYIDFLMGTTKDGKPRINRSQMLNDKGVPQTDAEIRMGLEYMHETIRTNGAHKIRDPGNPITNSRRAALKEKEKLKSELSAKSKILTSSNNKIKSLEKKLERKTAEFNLSKKSKNGKKIESEIGTIKDSISKEKDARKSIKSEVSLLKSKINKADFLSSMTMKKTLGLRGGEKRYLHLTPEGWIEYNDRFGNQDILSVFTDYIDSMAHDTSVIKIFGPDPDQAFEVGMRNIKKAKGQSRKIIGDLEDIFKVTTGEINTAKHIDWAALWQAKRNIISAAKLPAAILSAFADISTEFTRARYRGLNFGRAFTERFRQIFDEDRRVFATSMGFGADIAIHRANAGNRFADIYGTGKTAKVAEWVVRAQGLSAWTEGARSANMWEWSTVFANNFNKKFSDLSDEIQKGFEHYGINEVDWDTFRATKTKNYEGVPLADFTIPEAHKFHLMALTERDLFIPTPDARVESMRAGGRQRGTIEGEAWRSFMQLKSFPVTMALTHVMQIYTMRGTDRVKYFGNLMASGLIMGGISLQLKDMAKGKEPRPDVFTLDFFMAALLQGGGLGIFGDFLFSDVNRFGYGPTMTLAGPSASLLDSTARLTIGNLREFIAREETHVSTEAVRWLESITPGHVLTNPIVHAMFDSVALILDEPGQRKKINREIRREQVDYERGFWWKPGELTPEFAQ